MRGGSFNNSLDNARVSARNNNNPNNRNNNNGFRVVVVLHSFIVERVIALMPAVRSDHGQASRPKNKTGWPATGLCFLPLFPWERGEGVQPNIKKPRLFQ